MNRILPLCALLVSTLAAGCASEAGEQSTDSSDDALVNAPLDTKNAWAVGVCASEPNTDPAKGNLGACVEKGTRCTGSLIAPNLVLTSRHCVEEIDYSNATGFCDGAVFGKKLGSGNVRITLDPSVLQANPKWKDVVEVITEGAKNNSCENDIAILRLGAPIAAADAKPIALDTRPLAAHHPQKLAVVGRGILTSLIDLSTGAPMDDGPGADGGLKRRFKTDIPWVCVSNSPSRPCIIDDYTSPPTNKFSLPTTAYFAFGAGTSSGDSGSAVLSSAKFKAGHPVAVGVTSGGTADKDGVGNYGLGVRLDVHEAWLKATLRLQAAAASYTIVDSSTASTDE
jgi:hypothetical protein